MTKDNLIFSFGILISLIIIGISGFLYLQNIKLTANNEELIVIETPKSEVTIKPQEINYKNSEIEVLNASGKVGLAKTYAEKLEKLGYTKVKSANYNKLIIGNLLLAPTDFGKEIGLENYTFEKTETVSSGSAIIKIIYGK